MREGGGTVENTLKEGGTEKRGGDTKILKRWGGQAGSQGGCLKKERVENHLQTMVVFLFLLLFVTLQKPEVQCL